MFDVLLVVGFIVFIGVLLFFAYQESSQDSSQENSSEVTEPVYSNESDNFVEGNDERSEYRKLHNTIVSKLVITDYKFVTKSYDEFFDSEVCWYDLGLGLYVKSLRGSWKGLGNSLTASPSLDFANVNDIGSYVDILLFKDHINSLDKIESCEHPKNIHWKLFQEHEFKLKKEREDKMKSWVDSVIVKHQEYNDLSYKYESLPAAPVDNVDGFLNFCKILHEHVEYEDYEIQNYLTQKVMEFKKESYK